MEGYLGDELVPSLNETPFAGFSPAEWAMFYVQEYGSIDGEHHKVWLIDQVARILKGTFVEVRLARWSSGLTEYRFTTAEPPAIGYTAWRQWVEDEGNGWDEGIAP